MTRANYFKLLFNLTIRDLRGRYAGSGFGVFWTIVGPVFQAMVPAIVFSYLMTGRLGGEYTDLPFVVFFFSGFCVWALFADAVSKSGWVVRENIALVTKTNTPRTIFSLLPFTTALPNHLVLLLMTIFLHGYYGGFLGGGIFYLPLYFILASSFTLGIVRIISVFSVFILDVPHLLVIIITAWFFMTPILYSPELIQTFAPTWAQEILLGYNPMAHLVEGYRSCIVKTEFVMNWLGFLKLFLLCFSVYVAGSWFYRRMQGSFEDVL